MAWLKRNLFFAIGSVIALALLGAAVWYTFKSWQQNRDAMSALTSAYNELQGYYNKPLTPSTDNIAAAQAQEAQLRAWISQAQTHFAPVAPIPNPPDGVITTEQFAGTLRRTIYDLQQEALAANVDLPADYSFSFAAERPLMTFSPGSLNPMAAHLGEVKALCEVLFAAKVNALDSIQREVVSDNDTVGAQADFLTDKTRTDPAGLATITPYLITFRCFSSDLADVIAKMASSSHCFVVTGLNVMPAGASGASGGGNPTPPTTPGLPTGPGGLQTVLDEQLLRVTMGVEVVKLNKQ